jgi:ketosteroid isomerase-like protein
VQRCLTIRSTGPATAGAISLIRGTWCIIANQAYGTCLRGPVSSNVRRRTSPLLRNSSMKSTLLLLVALLVATPQPSLAQTPSYVGKRESSVADIQAIERVTVDFRTALTTKDTKLLSSLLLSDKILFTSPRSPANVRKQRETNVHADGVPPDARDFIRFVATSKVPIEERFYNIKIVQDGHVAWVTFDFDFLEDGKVENYGVEAWQMVKDAEETWKILSVVWSSKGTPR